MFTKEQRSRMVLKLAAMRNGDTFYLNKNDINPLRVIFTRKKYVCTLINPETRLLIASGVNETALVGAIIDAINSWGNIIRHYHLLIGTAK